MKKIDFIQHVLNFYYPEPPVPLNHKDDFTFLLAVVLSAQTTDGKVNQVTKHLFNLASTPEAMSKLSNETIQEIIQPVGLAPKKSVYLSKLSKIIVENFEGKIPTNLKDLESLPGVGRKTASVVMSQCFDVPSFAVDTHVHRLALRWGLSKSEKNVETVQKDLCNIFPVSTWNKLHLQMIYFGRDFCTAKCHTYSDCPICSWIHKEKLPQSASAISNLMKHYLTKKKVKGIVYYSDRIAELQLNPSMVLYSPHSAKKTSMELNKSVDLQNERKHLCFDDVEDDDEPSIVVKKIKK